MSRQSLDTFIERKNDHLALPIVGGRSRSNSGDKPSYDNVVRSHRPYQMSSRGDSKVRLPSVPDSSMDRRDITAYRTGSPSATSTYPGLTGSFSSSFGGDSVTGRSPLTPSSPPGDPGDSWFTHDRHSPSHASHDAVAATGGVFYESPSLYPTRALVSELATLPRSYSPEPKPEYPDGDIKVPFRPGELSSDRNTFDTDIDTYRIPGDQTLTSTRRQAPHPPTPCRQRRGQTLVAHDEVTRPFRPQARGYTKWRQESVEETDWRTEGSEGYRRRDTRYDSSSPRNSASDVSSPRRGYDRDNGYATYGSGPIPTLPRETRRAPRRTRALEVSQDFSPRGRQQSHDELLRSEEPVDIQVAGPRTRRARGDSRRRTDHSSDELYERRGRQRSLSRGLRGSSSIRLLNPRDTYVAEEIVEEKVPLGKRESSRSRKGSGRDSPWLVATIAGTALAVGLASYVKESKDVSKANRTGRGSAKSYSTRRPSRSPRRRTGTDSRGDSTGRTRRHSRERSMSRHDHHHRSSRRKEASEAEHERHRSDRARADDRESRGREVKQEDRTGLRRHRTADAHRDRGRPVESRRREKRRQSQDSKANNEDSLERRLGVATSNSRWNEYLNRHHGESSHSQVSGSDSDTEAVDSRRTNRSTAQSGRSHDRKSPIRPSKTSTSVEDTTNAPELSGRKRSRSVTIEDASDEDNMKSPTSRTSEPANALVPVLYLASEAKRVQEEAAKKAKEMKEREQRENRGASGSAKDAHSSKDDQGPSGPKGVR